MHKLLDDLSQTNSILEKEKILQSYKNNVIIKKLAFFALNPFLQTNIKKISKVSFGNLTLESSFDKFEDLFNKLTTRQITGNNARDVVDDFLSLCDEDTQDFYIRVLKKDLKCGFGDGLVKKIWGDKFIPKFEVQLANKYSSEKKYGVDKWYVTAKMDGIRLIYKGELLTRQGKKVAGFEHVEKELIDLCNEYNLNFVDGELFTENIGFQKLQGMITRDKNFDPKDKEKVLYNIFYIDNDKDTNTKQMVNRLHSINWEKYKYLRLVRYEVVTNCENDITAITEKYMSQGYEGAMLRDPQIKYSQKRDNNLLKVKFFIEEDFKIIDFLEGTGKFKNNLGAILVEGKYEGKKVKSQCGSGFDDEERTEIWNNKNKYLGKLVELKFQNLTDSENNDGNYSLRFPIFLKLKLDR